MRRVWRPLFAVAAAAAAGLLAAAENGTTPCAGPAIGEKAEDATNDPTATTVARVARWEIVMIVRLYLRT